MTTTPLPATRTLPAATLALALALAGAACSGGSGSDGTTADGSEARTTARAATSGGADRSPARLSTAEFAVKGMTCGGCVLATEMAVKKLDGVATADASYDEATGEGSCTVEYDASVVDTDRIAAAIEDAGFTPTLSSGPSTSPATPADEGDS